MASRLAITPAAAAMLAKLVAQHGPLLFHQSGGCCDGSAPMCFLQSEFRTGEHDLLLGEIGGCPFYISAFLFGYWQASHLTIDLSSGRGNSFSLEAPEGVRFITRSRLLSEEELVALDGGPCPEV